MIFEFRPLITDFASAGQPGVVVMATNYNASEIPYQSKIEMENSEYAVSVKPTLAMVHAIECSPQETSIVRLYVDENNISDPRFSDLGTFQFATQAHSQSGVVLGELWVSYVVEFFKPKLYEQIAGVSSAEVSRAAFSDASPLGAIQLNIRGNLKPIFSGSIVAWKSQPGEQWIVNIVWTGDVAGTLTLVDQPVLQRCTFQELFYNNSQSTVYSVEVGQPTRRIALSFCVKANPDNTIGDLVSFSMSGRLAGLPTISTQCSVTITRVDIGL
jgi:hypothetical protein